MAIRKYKPTTPGRRGSSVADFAEITRSTPEKSLLRPAARTRAAATSHGRITTRHQGGGHKRQYRLIDFKRVDKDGVPAKVAHIEYDPNRTARIALLHYADGEKRYIIAPKDLKQGDRGRVGPGRGHQAGQQPAAAQHPGRYHGPRRGAASGRRRQAGPLGRRRHPAARPRGRRTPRCACPRVRSGAVDVRCRATVGEIGNADQSNINWGKAGRMRWKGKRPTVRGVAMNPVDHPHGGGEGKTSGGRHPVNPKGKPEGRTRRKGQPSDRLIVRRRYATRKRG